MGTGNDDSSVAGHSSTDYPSVARRQTSAAKAPTPRTSTAKFASQQTKSSRQQSSRRPVKASDVERALAAQAKPKPAPRQMADKPGPIEELIEGVENVATEGVEFVTGGLNAVAAFTIGAVDATGTLTANVAKEVVDTTADTVVATSDAVGDAVDTTADVLAGQRPMPNAAPRRGASVEQRISARRKKEVSAGGNNSTGKISETRGDVRNSRVRFYRRRTGTLSHNAEAPLNPGKTLSVTFTKKDFLDLLGQHYANRNMLKPVETVAEQLLDRAVISSLSVSVQRAGGDASSATFLINARQVGSEQPEVHVTTPTLLHKNTGTSSSKNALIVGQVGSTPLKYNLSGDRLTGTERIDLLSSEMFSENAILRNADLRDDAHSKGYTIDASTDDGSAIGTQLELAAGAIRDENYFVEGNRIRVNDRSIFESAAQSVAKTRRARFNYVDLSEGLVVEVTRSAGSGASMIVDMHVKLGVVFVGDYGE